MGYYGSRKRLLRTSYKKIDINGILNINHILDPQSANVFGEYFSLAEIKYEISVRTLPSPFPSRFGCRLFGFYGMVTKFNISTKRKEERYYKIPYFRPIYIIALEQSKYRISKKILRNFISQIDLLLDGNILIALYWKSRMRFALIKDKFIITEWREEGFLISFDEYDMKLCDHNNFWKKIVCMAYGIDPFLLNKKSNVEIIYDSLQDEDELEKSLKLAKEYWGANDRNPFKEYAYGWKRPMIRHKNIKVDDDLDE